VVILTYQSSFGGRKLSYCVRLMQWEDITQVTEIDREAFPTMLPSTNFQRELKSPLSHYIVACDEGEVIDEPELKEEAQGKQYIFGFAGFWMMAGEAHIVNFAVRQSYRRQGIGELLLISLIDLAMEMKAHLITLEVRASNTAAQELYLKYGFTVKGIRRGYYSNDREDAVIMTLEDVDSVLFREQLNQLKQAHSRKWGIALHKIAR
jgi:ribosomal-protein-alanine N-acetyltransferase